MNEEWVEEIGESYKVADGSSKIESTDDTGVLASDEYCLMCRMEPKSHLSFSGVARKLLMLGLCLMCRPGRVGGMAMGRRYSVDFRADPVDSLES